MSAGISSQILSLLLEKYLWDTAASLHFYRLCSNSDSQCSCFCGMSAISLQRGCFLPSISPFFIHCPFCYQNYISRIFILLFLSYKSSHYKDPRAQAGSRSSCIPRAWHCHLPPTLGLKMISNLTDFEIWEICILKWIKKK